MEVPDADQTAATGSNCPCKTTAIQCWECRQMRSEEQPSLALRTQDVCSRAFRPHRRTGILWCTTRRSTAGSVNGAADAAPFNGRVEPQNVGSGDSGPSAPPL